MFQVRVSKFWKIDALSVFPSIYIHTYMHACIHTYIHTYIHTSIYTCTHTHIGLCMYIFIYIYIYMTYVVLLLTCNVYAYSFYWLNNKVLKWKFNLQTIARSSPDAEPMPGGQDSRLQIDDDTCFGKSDWTTKTHERESWNRVWDFLRYFGFGRNPDCFWRWWPACHSVVSTRGTWPFFSMIYPYLGNEDSRQIALSHKRSIAISR